MRNLWTIKINEHSSWHFFFLWGVCLTWGGWKSEEKVKWALLHLWKCFFLLNNNFSQFNHAAYHIDTKYMIPGLVSGLFGGGGVSMGVYKFYLGPHKSGKKEKYPYSNFLQHTVSIMSTSQCRILTWSNRWYHLTSWPLPGNITKYQEISARAATQNRNKTDYALTLEKYMYDTAK